MKYLYIGRQRLQTRVNQASFVCLFVCFWEGWFISKLLIFSMWITTFPNFIYWTLLLSSNNLTATVVKEYYFIQIPVHFWVLYFIPLIILPIQLPTSHYSNYYIHNFVRVLTILHFICFYIHFSMFLTLSFTKSHVELLIGIWRVDSFVVSTLLSIKRYITPMYLESL